MSNPYLEIDAAMRLAIEHSDTARGRTSPNPAVGAVILDARGRPVGLGATMPPGGPHAEVVALRQAGDAARGGTAVVTLEPCAHEGRTGPCATALVEAGIAVVHFAVADPHPAAAGGADTLRAAGVAVSGGLLADEAEAGPLGAWLFRQRTGRPRVTLKFAAGLDGRSAAADGTSQWITGPIARARVHEERARIDAIIVGTGTVLADDPSLTARNPDGGLRAHQPVRVVVGHRAIPSGARVLDGAAETLHIASRDLAEVLAALADRACDVQVEGGPLLAGRFLAAGLVDRVQMYQAPVILGAGKAAIEDTGIETIGQAIRWHRESIEILGPDVLMTFTRLGYTGSVDGGTSKEKAQCSQG